MSVWSHNKEMPFNYFDLPILKEQLPLALKFPLSIVTDEFQELVLL